MRPNIGVAVNEPSSPTITKSENSQSRNDRSEHCWTNRKSPGNQCLPVIVTRA